MKVIGITGRSGCGKSSVTAFFRARGLPCIDADQVAREVLLPGSACLARLQTVFGADIIAADGTLQRHLLADRAFATPQGTKALTDITHPEILRRIAAGLDSARQAGATFAFVDGAVIVGTPCEALCDALILVSTSYETSVQRIAKRDKISPEMARRRLDAQTPEQTLRAACKYEICNDGTLAELTPKCEAVFAALQKEAYGKDNCNP